MTSPSLPHQKNTERKQVVVAIDGPAGAGKSTAARRLADALGFTLVDTGAIYRALALLAKETGVPFEDEAGLGRLLESHRFGLGKTEVWVDGVDRSSDIRTPEISDGASKVSQYPVVRDGLLALQRTLAKEGAVVMEGRDIGTVVMPDAEKKFFLTATSLERARRRQIELSKRGIATDIATVQRDIEERDARDSGRDHAPLKQADDAILIDSTNMNLDQVVSLLATLVREG